MDYTTIREQAEAEYGEKKSRFIAILRPVGTGGEAQAFLESVRRAHPDARHHVSAWLTPDSERCSDDGEPSGTAGRPVFTLLKRRGFSHIAAVVVRYFGGVLLGAPGLVRAYGHTASLAADAASPVTMRECALFSFTCGYAELSGLERLARRFGRVRGQDYAEAVTFHVSVPLERAEVFRRAAAEETGGRVVPKEKSRVFEENLGGTGVSRYGNRKIGG